MFYGVFICNLRTSEAFVVKTLDIDKTKDVTREF